MSAVSEEAIREELNKILTSAPFARSERLRQFLSFTVEQSLSGAQENLKEYRIGVEVFGRGTDFDPRLDNIVRSHAHRLRGTLQSYYGCEGRSDPVVIDFPKGSYSPVYSHRTESASPPVDAPRRRAFPWTAAVVVACTLSGLAIGYLAGQGSRVAGPPAAVTHAALPIPPELRLTQGVGALSPDGRSVVLPAASAAGGTKLWLRALGGVNATAIPGTEGGVLPFWSPDGRQIAFFAGQKLKKLRLPDGPVQVLCDAPVARGGSWSASDVILFAPQSTDVIYEIAATGGVPRPVTRLDAGRLENAHRWPFFLPDGEQFLYFSRSLKPNLTGFYLGRRGSGDVTLILAQDSISNVELITSSATGRSYLLYVRNGALMAHPFDVKQRRVTGSPQVVAGGLPTPSSAYSFSAGGNLLILWRGSWATETQLMWLDRAGKVLGKLGAPGDFHNLELSPDGSRLAFVRMDEQYGTYDIWLMDTRRGTATRLTSDPASEFSPVWSPDGREVIYATEQFGLARMVRKTVDGDDTGKDHLLDTQYSQFPYDWSRDGRMLVYGEDHIRTHFDLSMLPVGVPGGKPVRLVATEANERDGHLSRDGRAIAYISDKSGRPEVYYRPLDGQGNAGQETRVSSAGGAHPVWDAAGRTLYFLENGSLMEALVPGGQPRALLAAPGVTDFALSPDGSRILVNQPLPASTPTHLQLIVNWMSELP
jgi:Tol biopolymer transport system component